MQLDRKKEATYELQLVIALSCSIQDLSNGASLLIDAASSPASSSRIGPSMGLHHPEYKITIELNFQDISRQKHASFPRRVTVICYLLFIHCFPFLSRLFSPFQTFFPIFRTLLCFYAYSENKYDHIPLISSVFRPCRETSKRWRIINIP